MNINVKICDVTYWYRESRHDWCIDVHVTTNNVDLSLRYSGKKINQAKRRLVNNLYQDILKEELDLRMNDILAGKV